MNKIKNTSKKLALLSVTAIALAACGGSSENSSSETTAAELTKNNAPAAKSDGPDAPIALAAIPRPNEVELIWKAPLKSGKAAIASYNVEMSDSGGAWLRAGSSKTTKLVVTGLTAGKIYDFRVSAVTPFGVGPAAIAKGVMALDPTRTTAPALTKGNAPAAKGDVPDAPVALSAIPRPNEVELIWKAPLKIGKAPIASYNVEMSSDSGATWSRAGSSKTTKLVVTGLTAGKTYDFRVSAVSPIGGFGPAAIAKGVKLP